MRAMAIPALAMAFLVLPAYTAANTIDAPASVMADAAGNFSYAYTLTIGESDVTIAGWGGFPGENTQGIVHGDCFCLPNCVVAAGSVLTWTVEGSLINPAQSGTVQNWASFCDAQDIETGTTVLPFDPTPVRPTTWGRIKSLF